MIATVVMVETTNERLATLEVEAMIGPELAVAAAPVEGVADQPEIVDVAAPPAAATSVRKTIIVQDSNTIYQRSPLTTKILTPLRRVPFPTQHHSRILQCLPTISDSNRTRLTNPHSHPHPHPLPRPNKPYSSKPLTVGLHNRHHNFPHRLAITIPTFHQVNQLRRHTSGLASKLRHLTLHTHHNLRTTHSIHLQWLVHPSHQEHLSIPLSSGLHRLIRPSFRRPQHNHIINRYKGHTVSNQRAPIPAEYQQTTSPQDITT